MKTTPLCVPALVLSVVVIGLWGCEKGQGPHDPDSPPTVPISEASNSDFPRPNVVWIMLDALRASNLSTYGYNRLTSPNLDKLAEQGVVFERNFTQATCTVLSVPSYMTGKYYPVSCLTTLSWKTLFKTPPAQEKLLPQILNANGYETALVSASYWLSSECRLWNACQEQFYIEPPGPWAYAEFDTLNTAAAGWLNTREDAPFFLYIHAMDTHFPHALNPPPQQVA